jgi:hypothetical protein
MSEYELGWTIFHGILGFLSYSGIIALAMHKENPTITLSFKAVSIKQPEASDVVHYGRFRGHKEGQPMAVVGYSQRHAEDTLRDIRDSFSYYKSAQIVVNRKDNLSVKIKA